jgi:hypothetical protein
VDAVAGLVGQRACEEAEKQKNRGYTMVMRLRHNGAKKKSRQAHMFRTRMFEMINRSAVTNKAGWAPHREQQPHTSQLSTAAATHMPPQPLPAFV